MLFNVIKYALVCLMTVIIAASTSKSSEIQVKAMLVKLVREYNPRLKPFEAKVIAKELISVNKLPGCKVSWDLLLSIAINESSLNYKAYNKNTKDYGLMQINENSIKRMGLDKKRLLRDLRYNLYTGCRILTENKERYAHKKAYWIGVYNSGIAFQRPVVVRNAKKYDTRIKKTLKSIKERSVQIYASNI